MMTNCVDDPKLSVKIVQIILTLAAERRPKLEF
jgi:hypothetical protein